MIESKHPIPQSKLDYVSSSNWYEVLREHELSALLSDFEFKQFSHSLELGCGAGWQSRSLLEYTNSLISGDIDLAKIEYDKVKGVDYLQIDAQDLSSFPAGGFDFVYSSNVLEHVPNLEKSLGEMHRVLANGFMVHAVPNNTWKIFHLLLFYPRLLLLILGKINSLIVTKRKQGRALSKINLEDNKYDDNMRVVTKKSRIFRAIFPKPHGISSNHLSEFIRWRKRAWIRAFEENGFIVVKIIHLPFYYGHGLFLKPLLKLGNRIGLSSCTGYVLRKQ